MPDADSLTRLAVALSIGLMVGIERGWRTREIKPHSRAAGLRTFGLSGLMGGVCGLLNPYSEIAAETGQPAFSWRGRITCSAAASYAGTVDNTGRKPGRGPVRRGQASEIQGFGSVVELRARRLGLRHMGAALRPSLRGSGRRGRLPDRHRDAGAARIDQPREDAHRLGTAMPSGADTASTPIEGHHRSARLIFQRVVR